MKELKTHRDVVLAMLDGHELEIRSVPDDRWKPIEFKTFYVKTLDEPTDIYRIKPTKPSIDWSHVSDEYKYLARDMDGLVYLYVNKPKRDGDDWWALDGGKLAVAKAFKSLDAGNCDWTESLVERPKN